MANATAKTAFPVGTVVYISFGYDQTRVNYYEVVERRGSHALIAQIDSEVLFDGTPGGGNQRRAIPGAFLCDTCNGNADAYFHQSHAAQKAHAFAYTPKRVQIKTNERGSSFKVMGYTVSEVNVLRFSNADPLVASTEYYNHED